MLVRPLLCVDFDGTIWDGNQIIPGCINTLSRLRKTYRIAIFSARATEAERTQMKRLLDYWGVPYDEILAPKPNAVAFIDDKAIRFESWDQIKL